MKKTLLFCVFAFLCAFRSVAQSNCTAISFDFDLSASIDTSVSVQSTRSGDCCGGNNCIKFNLKLNPACSYVNFTVANPAPPGNAAYYQLDCGPQTSLGTPLCIVGKTEVTITFCKPGNDNPIYTIVAAGAIKGSEDITVREGCTGSLNVAGLLPATITWTSIFPGAQGSYDSFLSCTSGCPATNVTPLPGTPAYIDYKVSGNRLCGPVVNDTIRVFTTPQISVALSPNSPAVCAGGTSNVTLTATAAGGVEPYNFVWNNGQTGNAITVNSGGTYTVSVTDAKNCLPALQTKVVATTPLPAAPALSSNSPVCEGGSINLFATAVAGASYRWTGPNGFTSTAQNPVIANTSAASAGSYSVIVTVGECSSIPASTAVVVNPIPAPPLASGNAPVCQGAGLNLSASTTPGGTYAWTGPNGFSSSLQNPGIANVTLQQAGVYAVTVNVNGCTSAPATLTATINPLPPAPVVATNSPLCSGNSLALTAADITGATYAWSGPNGYTSSLQSPTIANAGVNLSGTYSVRATVNGCTGPSGTTSVIINPIPAAPGVSSNGPVCEGSALNFTASTISGASYAWTGPNGFSSSLQNPGITQSTVSASGSYAVTATVNGCTSAPNELSVAVKPVPALPRLTGNSSLCEGSTLSLTASSSAGASYTWTGPNGFAATTQNVTIASATPLHSGTYAVTASLNGCSSQRATIQVTVKALPLAPGVSSNSPVCSGNSILLNASSITGATYAWSGPEGFTSSLQNPLIANASIAANGNYTVVVTVNGCSSAVPSSTNVLVNPTPDAPLPGNSGPVCEGGKLTLSAAGINGAAYYWSGPGNFTASTQAPSMANVTTANAGDYLVMATLNGCASAAAKTTVAVHKAPTVSAGDGQFLCSSAEFAVLSGTVSGYSSSGEWSTTGSGIFLPDNKTLNAKYYPSATDKALNMVSLTLTSTNNGACAPAIASAVINFVPPPTAVAGSDQVVCENNANVSLNGSLTNAAKAIWTTSGSGTFSPSATTTNATYLPGAGDKNNGSVKLVLTTVGTGPCPAASDELTVSIKAPPVIKAENVNYILENNSTVLSPVVSGLNPKCTWSPALYLSNALTPNPVCTPKEDITYQLTAVDEFGCEAAASVKIKILRQPEVPNVFTPNGDGINDKWQIKHLVDYADCNVEIFNRYGQVVYRGTGYTTAWDGTSKGIPLPAGTYYYIIHLKNGLKPLSGFVDIVK